MCQPQSFPNFSKQVFALDGEVQNQDLIRKIIARHKFIESSTNFVEDYATSNYLEDFAETLEAYYMHTRYKFAGPLIEIQDPDKHGVLYTFDTEKIMTTQMKQRDKTCKIVELVMKERCKLIAY
jgi:hypothetical protein